MVKENGLDDGDEYVVEFKKNRRLVFYIGGEKVCLDRISLVKESGDLFGEKYKTFEFFKFGDAQKFAEDNGFNDWIII